MTQAALADLAKAIDELVTGDASACADADSIIELHRQLTRLEAVVTRAVGAFDNSGGWVSSGAQSAASWVTHHCGVAASSARKVQHRARHLRQLPLIESTYGTGDLTSAHVDALVHVDRPPTSDVLQRDESLLVDQAKALSFAHFTRALSYWEQFADPDGSEERAERQRTRRDVTLVERAFGTFLGSMTLDPISGTIVASELDRLERIFFADDWKQAKADLGRDPRSGELPRTPAQRRADALVEMATRSKMASETHRRPTPLVTVLVDYETMANRVCELANGCVVTPGSLLPYLDEALIERAVFRPDGRVEIGQATRLFTGATRRAVEVRDRRCQHPLCEQPAERCQVDHITPASARGPTIQTNGRVLCPFHNRLAWENYRVGRPWDAGSEVSLPGHEHGDDDPGDGTPGDGAPHGAGPPGGDPTGTTVQPPPAPDG